MDVSSQVCVEDTVWTRYDARPVGRDGATLCGCWHLRETVMQTPSYAPRWT